MERNEDSTYPPGWTPDRFGEDRPPSTPHHFTWRQYAVGIGAMLIAAYGSTLIVLASQCPC